MDLFTLGTPYMLLIIAALGKRSFITNRSTFKAEEFESFVFNLRYTPGMHQLVLSGLFSFIL